MRFFPEEIENDLLDRGLNIFDWWNRSRDANGRLKLSSRRLISYVRGLPDDSRFKTATRSGDFTTESPLRGPRPPARAPVRRTGTCARRSPVPNTASCYA